MQLETSGKSVLWFQQFTKVKRQTNKICMVKFQGDFFHIKNYLSKYFFIFQTHHSITKFKRTSSFLQNKKKPVYKK